MTFAKYAPALGEFGLDVFPVTPHRKSPPLVKAWQDKATSDPAKIAAWAKEYPDANIGVHLGARYFAVDVDVRNGGPASLAKLQKERGTLPATFKPITASAGEHWYFKLPEGHPGVGNSAGKLAPGIDVKGRSGYVLAPGSVVNGKRYRLEAAVPIADAPQWLLDLIGEKAAKARDKTPAAAIPPAADDTIERAREWLARQPSGEGAYATACGLRDRGVSLDQAQALMLDHDPRPNVPEKVEHAYKFAQNVPGAKVATADDFATLAPSPAPVAQAVAAALKPERGPSKLLTPADLSDADVLFNEYAVKNWIDLHGEFVIFGDSGAGKTFLVLDILACIAQGLPWHGARTRKLRVLYAGYEGKPGLKRRIRALAQKYPGLESAAFAWWPMRHPLTTPKGHDEIKEARQHFADKFGGVPDVIVIDTLRAALGGSDSDADLVERLRGQVRALFDASTCAIGFVHHVGHGEKGRERGDSGIRGGTESSIRVEGPQTPGGVGTIEAVKQRDSALLTAHYRLRVVPLGLDQDGDTVTTCTADEAQPAEVEADLIAPGPSADEQIDEAAASLLRLLAREAKAGREHSIRSLVRLAPDHGMPVRMAHKALDRLEGSGRVVQQKKADRGGHGRSYRLAIVGDLPEGAADDIF